ncbi:MAG: glycerol dehydrogenase [Acidobacteria bacterium]|nr:glycerol dehydrogenase [Acidobacteriota bacterium]
MTTRGRFSPHAVFSTGPGGGIPPRVLAAPSRYVQGNGVIDLLGTYLSLVPAKRPLVLTTEGGRVRLGRRLEESFRKNAVQGRVEIFGGECSLEEVERVVEVSRKYVPAADCVVAAGGGKCIDAGKAVAFRLDVPAVICPTIASTDAPCSAVSILYTPAGVGKGPEFYPRNPALVVVDTGVIAAAPARHLISGMGDALATGYEARTCYGNPEGRSIAGARMTIAALAIAELCAKTVFEDGMRAVDAMRRGEINESLERVIEANTLLSGVGFESCGLAAAHAYAAGLTVIEALHRDFLHGEMVAAGLMAHLLLEGHPEEAGKAARFLNGVGLPVCLEQFGLDPQKNSQVLMDAMKAAAGEPIVNNEPFEITPEKLLGAFLGADRLGREIIREEGSDAFKRLHVPE